MFFILWMKLRQWSDNFHLRFSGNVLKCWRSWRSLRGWRSWRSLSSWSGLRGWRSWRVEELKRLKKFKMFKEFKKWKRFKRLGSIRGWRSSTLSTLSPFLPFELSRRAHMVSCHLCSRFIAEIYYLICLSAIYLQTPNVFIVRIGQECFYQVIVFS